MKSNWKIVLFLAVWLVAVGWAVNDGRTPATTSPTTIAAGRGPSGRQLPVNAQASATMEGPLVTETAPPQLSRPVRELPVAQPEPILETELNPRQNPFVNFPLDFPNISGPADPLLQIEATNNGRTPTPTLTFEGVDNFCGCSPPDTIGDVGPNHYVQMVNATKFNIYDKNGNLLTGPTDLNDLWSSGNCSVSDNGDPIVVYDSLADRWVLAQFSTGNGVCVAVSQTADPTGAYYGYEFTTPTFPDYFKISVWPDAYYMTANESSYTAFALERADMLNGLPATSVRFSGQTNFLLAADVDGPTPPPANTPGLFYTFKDNSFHGGTDRLEIFELDVDWVTPGNSTFTLAQSLNITSYTYTVCGFFVLNCIPQLGTTQRVDAVSEWPMWRLAYRNFGSHETLLANFAVDVGSDRSGIRWYELRRSGGTWSIYQEGTHAPADTTHRFMGSIAMDGQGNIALAYSASSSTMNPAIRYATRLASDPLGTLQAEETLYAGAGSQTGSNRWGDYSAISIDPSDDCTFWVTNEYYPSNSGNNWNTRIGKFTIPECLADPTETDLSLSKSASAGAVFVGETITYTVNVSNNGPISATNVVVTDVLPAEVSYVSNDSGCNESGGTVTCNLGTLLDGDAATIEIVVTAVTPGSTTNTASVTSDTPDSNPGNNSDDTPVVINGLPTADLEISKTAVLTTAQTGDLITYTLVITNHGPDTAVDVTVTDVLPAQVSYLSNDAGCVEASGTVTCVFGLIPVGSSETVQLVVSATQAGEASNTATVTSVLADPDESNNSSTAVVTITGETIYTEFIYLPIVVKP
jgi:uncharacterized repeat protein (TIGR01451 family)